MRIFISAGEPSGDLHGSNLAKALRVAHPTVELFGLGGGQMNAAGVDLLYPLADHAIMGFIRVVRLVPMLADLLDRIAHEWQRRQPDAVVLIDYPGFHWWVAARAKAMGIPVISFVPPQIWAWASYRVKKMRANFDYVLCALPFEEAWFRDRGVPAKYVGHPYFDELSQQVLDRSFLAQHQLDGRPLITLLPGSRGHEVTHNLESMVTAARMIHFARPDVRFAFACFQQRHASVVAQRLAREQLPIEIVVGKTPELIEMASACIAVSGSVSLELLYRLKPTVVVYRTTGFYHFLTRLLKNVPYISLVNLLAECEIYPELLTTKNSGDLGARHILKWLDDSAALQCVATQLQELKSRVGQPGACTAAAEFLVSRFSNRQARAA